MTNPILTGLAPSISLAENTVNAAPQLLFDNVTLTDPEGLAGGVLRVTGLLAEDSVSVRGGAPASGTVSVSGDTVTYAVESGHTQIIVGTISGGVGADLRINLAATATVTAVEALIEGLTYANSSDTPTAERDLTLHLTDAAGIGIGLHEYTPVSYFTRVDVGVRSTIAFPEIDGNQYTVVGRDDGRLTVYDGLQGSSPLGYGDNVLRSVSVDSRSAPAFVDIDGDGDLDAVVGNWDGSLEFFANYGILGFASLTGDANPLGGIDAGQSSTPAFVDVNGDGRLDIVVGNLEGALRFFYNLGAAGYVELNGASNPFSHIDVGSNSAPAFVDFDDDGDLDLAVGAFDGTLHAFENTGGGIYSRLTGAANPFNGLDVGLSSTPAFVDFDGDGDLDVVMGDLNGKLTSYRQSQQGLAFKVKVAAENEAPVLTGLAPAVSFAEDTVNAAPQLLFGDVTLTEPEGDDFGVLLVTGLLAEDTVSVLDGGTGARAIGLSGADVTYGGRVIGTLGGGVGTDLRIEFVAGAKVAAVEALIESITYANASGTPTADRTLQLQLTDAAGASITPGVYDAGLTGAANPLNGVDAGDQSAPVFVDLDGDGDLDLVVGGTDGARRAFVNDGDGGFAELTGSDNPLRHVDTAVLGAPAFADIDGDGDLDLVVGGADGKLLAFANDGAGSYYTLKGDANPFGDVDVGQFSTPAFGDVDSDGDLDLVVGAHYGKLRTFANDGAGGFAELTWPANPFGLVSVGGYSAPTFADLDGDGDHDAVIGAGDGTLHTYENDGIGGFAALTGAANPLDGVDAGDRSAAAFADIDGDGDLDAVVGGADGTLRVITQTRPGLAVAVTVAPENDAPVLTGLAPAVAFGENAVNAAPQLLFGDVTLTDPEGLAGGVLRVTGLRAEDTVSVLDGGTGAGVIGLSGADVTYGGATIGTLSGGDGAELRIDLTAGADAAAVEALIESIAYANSSDTPAASRTLRLHLTDAAGDGVGVDDYNTKLTGAANPFNGMEVLAYAAPAFGDLDGDGELDLVIGSFDGTMRAFFGDGAGGYAYRVGATNQFNGGDVGWRSTPVFADFDGDGDLDFAVGEDEGTLLAFANDGAGGFAALTGAANPFDGVYVIYKAAPAFADFDADGDLDLVVGAFDGKIRAFANDGAGGFAALSGAANPFNGVDVGDDSTPAFLDLDGDGDLDLVAGAFDGKIRAFANDGAGGFAALTDADDMFNGVDVGHHSAPAFLDIDGDGDLDAVVGAGDGTLHTFARTLGGHAVVVTVGAENDAPVLADAAPALPDQVNGRAPPSDPSAGARVSTLTGGATDPDGGAIGIAVIAVAAGAVLHVSLDGGATWAEAAAPTASAALLLAPDARVAMTTGDDFSGTIADALTIRAWDGSVGASGDVVDATATGGAAAFSDAADTVALTVTQNHAPVLADAALALPEQTEDLAPPIGAEAGAPASSLTGGATDADGDAIGIAVIAVAAGATLHVSLDGGATWAEAAAPTPSAALLLAPDARVAMTTGDDFSGTIADALTIRAWDGSVGASGDVVDATVTGGAAAFSDAADTVALTVTGVNDPAVLTGLATSVTFAENTVNAAPQLLFGDVTLTDPEGFAGGVLLVTGLLAEDTASLLDGGTGAGAIGLSGGSVTYGGAVIGTLGGGVGADLRIDLIAGADAAAVEALIESITYANASDAPTADRTLRLHLIDAAGEGVGAGAFFQLTGAANPFDDVDAGFYSMPAFVDLDADGDLDAVVGAYSGVLRAFVNDGDGGFDELTGTDNPLGGLDMGTQRKFEFADIDGDGDFDLVVGSQLDDLRIFANDGDGGYAELSDADNPLAGVHVSRWAAPGFGDIDGDGDIDAVIGAVDGTLRVFDNDGTGGYAELTGAANPFNGVDVGDISAPAFADIDGDGDADAVVGAYSGVLRVFANDGAGGFAELTGAANPFGSFYPGTWSVPAFADLDDDGDLDAVVGEYNGKLRAFAQTAGGVAVAVTVTPENDPTTSSLPAFVTAVEDVASGLDLSGLNLSDGDVTDVLPLVLAADAGALSALDAGSVTVSGSGTGTLTLLGTAADLNAYLAVDGAVTYLGAQDAHGDAAASLSVAVRRLSTEPRINEIHYDNLHTDTDEFIEVRVVAGADVSAMSVELYNGSSGALYGAAALSGAHAGGDAAYDYYVLDIAAFGVSGIQNGAPDGMALIDGGAVVEFLSYEGDFTATDGTAEGLTSTDIGVTETNSSVIGHSLQRGDGDAWRISAAQTQGAANGAGSPDVAPLGSIAINITAVTDLPVLTGLSPAVSFAENAVNAAPQLLDADVVFTAPDSDFDGGRLTVDGLLAEDAVGVRDAAGQIGIVGAVVSFGGVAIGTLAGGDGAALTVSFNGAATAEGIDALIQSLTYANDSDAPTTSRDLIISVTDAASSFAALTGADDGAADQTRTGLAVTVTVTPENDAPTAQDDALATDEETVLSGSVLADNGAGADVDPDGDALTIAAVNGEAASVGAQITLSSGALLTLGADGSYEYDPNGAFEFLGGSGLSTFTDAFTYTVSDGDLTDDATVIVTTAGVNDAPEITSPAAFSVGAGETAIGAVAATDPEGDFITYAIAGGADAALFAIDGVTGALSFRAPPAGGAYAVTVAAFDGLATARQDVTITAPKPIGEVVQLTVGTSWQTLTFANTYADAVVFALAPSLNEAEAATARFQNITGTGAEIRLQEPGQIHGGAANSGDHIDEVVTLLVLEKGVHRLEDGTIIQVGELETGKVSANGFEDVAFDGAFDAAPSIFSQVQTYNDADFVVSRQRDPGADGFELTMQEEQAGALGHAAETVGWFAIAHGGGTLSTMDWQAGSSAQSINGNLAKIHFNDRFDEAPLVMASLASYNGTDTASARIGSVQRDGFKAVALEDRSFDAETQHGFEVVDWMAFSNEGSIHAAAPEQVIAEAGFAEVSNVAVTVSFGSQFEHPVVIASLNSMADGAAAIARAFNVTETGFDLILQTPGGDAHGPETVSWMVVEAGSWQLADGTMLQAGLTDPGAGFASVAFDAGFDDGPAVLSQTQTMDDAAFVKTRMQGVDGAGFDVALEGSEAADGGAETVGWIAVDMGRASDSDGFVFEAGEISANQKWRAETFTGDFDAPGVVAGMSSYHGTDAAAARLGAITGAGFQISAEEDRTHDAETFHATEQFHWIAFDQSQIWGDALV